MSVHLRLIATLLALAAWSAACSSPSATPEYTPALPATTIATPIPTITPDPTLLTPPPGPAPSPSVTPIRQLPVTNLAITPDEAVWYSFGALEFHPRGGGIVRLHRGEQTHFMPEANVQLLEVGPDGSVWAGMGCGLARFDDQAWQTLIENCDPLQGNIIDIAFAPDGAAWIATGFKLVRYRDGTWTMYDRLAHSLAVTPDGALWVAGWEGRQGSQYVARFDGTRFSLIERIATGRLLTGPDGSLWSFQDTGALARFDGQAWRAFADLPFQQIEDLAIAPDGVLWLATDSGLLRFDGGQWLHDASAPDGITQIAFAPDGSLWLGDFRGQVFLHNPTQVEPLPTPTSTPTLDPSLPTQPPPPTLDTLADSRG
jgi:streptogramin lyase